MFLLALFSITERWKQPKCPSTGEWVIKMPHIHKVWNMCNTRPLHVMKFWHVCRTTWMDLENIWKNPVVKDHVSYTFYMKWEQRHKAEEWLLRLEVKGGLRWVTVTVCEGSLQVMKSILELENGMEEPGGLQPTRSQRAGHNWATKHTHTVVTHRGGYTKATEVCVLK